MTEALDLVLSGRNLDDIKRRARTPSVRERVRLFDSIVQKGAAEVDLELTPLKRGKARTPSLDDTPMKRGRARNPSREKVRSAPTEALELLLGDSAHFGPAKVEALEGTVVAQQKRIKELEKLVQGAASETEALKRAGDALQAELETRPPSPCKTQGLPEDEPFLARMNREDSVSSLDALAADGLEDRPQVDEVTALRAESAAFQKMVRKLHSDLKAAHAQSRRDQEALAAWQAAAEEAQRAAEPILLHELELARQDLAREERARRELEEKFLNLTVLRADFTAKREPVDRELAGLAARAAGPDPAPADAEARAPWFSLRRLCRSLSGRETAPPHGAPPDDGASAPAA